MNALPPEAMILLTALPLLGLGILAVVLFSLGVNRDRYILPGAFAVVLAVSSWGAAKQYGPRVKDLLAKPAPATPGPDQPGPSEIAANGPETRSPHETKPAPEAADDRNPGRKEEEPKLIPVIDNDPKTDDKKSTRTEPFKRREFRGATPTPESSEVGARVPPPAQPPEPRPEIKPPPRPEPPPEPPKTIAPKPVTPPEPPPKPVTPPEPPPKPVTPPEPPPKLVTPPEPPPKPVTPPEPPPKPITPPKPSSDGGAPGTLQVKLSGTIVENSTSPARQPHMLVILDGRQVEILPPSNTSETYAGGDPGKGLQGVLYTWQGLTVTFTNLEPGFHFIMIDSALDNPSAHQASMLGAGKDDNDYNGTVEIKPGEGAVMDFGNKNVMNGKLQRRR